jgi:hypothetical protein
MTSLVLRAQPLAVNIAAAAAMTSISATKLDEAIRAGTLPARHYGNRLVIRVADLEKWVDSFPEGRPAPAPHLEGRRTGRRRKQQQEAAR